MRTTSPSSHRTRRKNRGAASKATLLPDKFRFSPRRAFVCLFCCSLSRQCSLTTNGRPCPDSPSSPPSCFCSCLCDRFLSSFPQPPSPRACDAHKRV
jgi:hypothetical protein